MIAEGLGQSPSLRRWLLQDQLGGRRKRIVGGGFGLVSGLVEVIFREWVTPQLGPECK